MSTGSPSLTSTSFAITSGGRIGPPAPGLPVVGLSPGPSTTSIRATSGFPPQLGLQPKTVGPQPLMLKLLGFPTVSNTRKYFSIQTSTGSYGAPCAFPAVCQTLYPPYQTSRVEPKSVPNPL